MKTAEKSPSEWVAGSIAEVARFLRISTRQAADYFARGCPGEPKTYPLDEVVQWCKDNVWKPRPAPIDDPLMGGAESPGLERYRLAKAEQEEIKLATMRGDYIPRAELDAILGHVSDCMQTLGESLQLSSDPRASEHFNRAVENLERFVKDRYGSSSGGENNAA